MVSILVIALNILPCKQKAEMERELIRRKKMKKSDLMQEIMSTRKPKQKKARIGGRKEKKRYDWIAIFF